MKKFSDVIETIRKVNEQELSDLQKSYREYFTDKLKKFEAESPADLNDEQKKEFFNEIKKDWEKGKGVKESQEINESALAIAGGIILGALGINLIAKIFKSVSAGVSLARVTDPGKMKEIADQLSTEAITNKGINPAKAVLWQQTVEGMINTGEIKNAFELAKSIRGINDIDIKEVFEGESQEIIESDIKSKEDFAKFAKDKLKKVHGDDFDEEKAQEVIDGLSKDAEKDDNWGAAVGRLNKA